MCSILINGWELVHCSDWTVRILNSGCKYSSVKRLTHFLLLTAVAYIENIYWSSWQLYESNCTQLLCDEKRLAYVCYGLSSDETFSSSKRPDRQCGPLSLIFTGYVGSFLWAKRLGCQVGHSSASGAEVRNEWSCTSTLFLCLHGVDRERFTFF